MTYYITSTFNWAVESVAWLLYGTEEDLEENERILTAPKTPQESIQTEDEGVAINFLEIYPTNEKNAKRIIGTVSPSNPNLQVMCIQCKKMYKEVREATEILLEINASFYWRFVPVCVISLPYNMTIVML